jgi:hypothetical protein
MTTIKPDSSAAPANGPTNVDTSPASSPAIPAGHVPQTVPMDGVATAPDCVSRNGKPVSGYNGSDPY